MASFADIANTDFSSIEAPKPVPAGEYVVKISKVPTNTERDDAIVIEFPLVIVNATDDVDLSDYEGSVVGKPLRKSFWVRPGDKEEYNRNMYALKRFLSETLGLDVENMKLPQALNESVGCEFIAAVTLTMGNDGLTYANAGKVRALAD